VVCLCFFFFSSRRRHTRFSRDWSSDVCSSDLYAEGRPEPRLFDGARSPRFAELMAGLPPSSAPGALIGQCIDVAGSPAVVAMPRSEERRVGKECSSRGTPDAQQKNTEKCLSTE